LLVSTAVEHTEAHYEVWEVEFGRVYKWCPESVVVECECGERPVLTASETACGCGADHAATVCRELSAERSGDEVLHPWRYVEDSEEAGIPY
jgi:hypothetical protein